MDTHGPAMSKSLDWSAGSVRAESVNPWLQPPDKPTVGQLSRSDTLHARSLPLPLSPMAPLTTPTPELRWPPSRANLDGTCAARVSVDLRHAPMTFVVDDFDR